MELSHGGNGQARARAETSGPFRQLEDLRYRRTYTSRGQRLDYEFSIAMEKRDKQTAIDFLKKQKILSLYGEMKFKLSKL